MATIAKRGSKRTLFAYHTHGAGLRAFFALFFGKGNSGANFEAGKGILEHAVLMKIDLTPVLSHY